MGSRRPLDALDWAIIVYLASHVATVFALDSHPVSKNRLVATCEPDVMKLLHLEIVPSVFLGAPITDHRLNFINSPLGDQKTRQLITKSVSVRKIPNHILVGSNDRITISGTLQ